MKATFGEYIRQLRTDKGFTLTELAALLKLDSANLSKIENNKREFDEKRLDKLLRNAAKRSSAFFFDNNKINANLIKTYTSTHCLQFFLYRYRLF